jgi:hypothetical protein
MKRLPGVASKSSEASSGLFPPQIEIEATTMNIKEMIAMKPAHTPEELEQAVEEMIVFNGLIYGEDPAKLDEMRRMLYRHYKPEGFERIFVEDILRGLWKYRRYQAMEYWMTRMEMEQMK